MVKKVFSKLLLTRPQWCANRTSFLLCALSGLFGGIIFHQNWLGIFAWVALAPYSVALGRFRTAKEIVWGTYIFGFIWYYLNLWWLHTLTVFSLWIPAGVPVLALIQATYFLAFAFPANFVLRRFKPWAAPWLLALMWPGMEYLRTWTDLAFPWNYLGHSQPQAGVPGKETPEISIALYSTAQWAEFGGVYLISFLLVLVSAAISQAITFRKFRHKLITSLLSVGAIAAIIVFGLILAAGWKARPNKSHIDVALIQPGISQIKKWDATMGLPGDDANTAQRRFIETDREMKDAAMALVHKSAAKKPHLYLLPETTFLSPYFVYQSDLHRELHDLAIALNADIFFGANNRVAVSTYFDSLRHAAGATTLTLPQMPLRVNDQGVTVPEWEKEPEMANFNSAWLVTPKRGLQPAAYNKIQLVPFGEMVPIVGGFEWFQKMAMAGSFYPGADAPIFESHEVKFGSVICFESAFSSLTSALARKGAQMLVVLTNDAWYDPKYMIEKGGFWGTLFKIPGLKQLAAAGPNQHFAHSIFRAIETRLPLLRCANTGISTVVEPNGDFQSGQMDYSTSGQMVAHVGIAEDHKTLYTRYGDWFAWLSLVTLVAVLAAMVRTLKSDRQKSGTT